MSEVTLRGRVDLHRGQSYKSALLDVPGPVLLGLGTIQRNGGFKGGDLRTYGGDSPTRILVHPGDLYLSLKDVTHKAELLGAVARVPEGIEVGRLTQDTVRLQITADDVLPEYLYWLLQSPRYRAYCRAHGTGTTNLDLSRSDFLSFPFRLPPLPEQQAIAEVLGALDDKIAANTKLAAATQAHASVSVASAAANGAVRLLGEVVDFHNKRRVPVSSREREGRNGNVPYYGANGAMGTIDEALFDEPLVLMGEDGSVVHDDGTPFIHYIWGPSWVNNHAHVLTGRGISTELLSVLLRGADVSSLVTGAVQPKLSMGQAKKIEVQLPNQQEIADLEALVGPLMACVRAVEEESRTLAATRDALLPQLMSGKLRVRDAEVVASRAGV